jgi:hypothetical protein
MDRQSLKLETQAAFRGVAKPDFDAIAPHSCI